MVSRTGPKATRSALGLALAAWVGIVGGVGCRSEEQKSDPGTVEVSSPKSGKAEPAPGAAGSADDARCRDWSTLDLDDLPELPPSSYRSVLEVVWQRVLEKHYDPTLGCVDWLEQRRIHGEKLVGVEDRAKAYAIIDDMLEALEQSHFRLFPPSGAPGTPGPAKPPVQVRWIENQLVVVRSEGAIPTGSVLESIDGRPVQALIEAAKARAQDEDSSAFAFEVARAAGAELSCAGPGETLSVEFEDPKGERRTRSLTCERPKGELVSLGSLENVPTRVEHSMIPKSAGPSDSSIGYLAFNVWMLPMVQRVAAAMEELRGHGMEALIIDLRGNPGGVGPMSVPVARLLLDEKASLGTMRFRDFDQHFRVQPGKDPFTGPVAVLVDEGTASTSEIFVAGLRDLGRVTVVGGRASAGAALPSIIERLEGGAVLQYVVGDYHSPAGAEIEGTGVVPDSRVVERRRDFVQGRDPVLQAAVEHLRNQLAEAQKP